MKKMISAAFAGILALTSLTSAFSAGASSYSSLEGSPILDTVSYSLSSSELEVYAQTVIALVNEERAANGVGELKCFPILDEMSDVRAEELLELYSHTRPDGRHCRTIFADYGVDYGYRGENIAGGYETPEEVMEGWMNSEGHRENILLPEYEYISVGVSQDSTGELYWVQTFCSLYETPEGVYTPEAPVTEAPTTEPTTEATTEPTTEAPTTAPTTEPPTEVPATETTTEDSTEGELAIVPDELYLTVGETAKVSLVNVPEGAYEIWFVTDPDIVDISMNTVTALSEGTAYIYVDCGDVSAMCKVVVTAPAEYVSGDADLDGVLSVNDVVTVMCYSVNSTEYPLSDEALLAADVYQTGDGVNSSDAFSIQKKLVNLIESLPES